MSWNYRYLYDYGYALRKIGNYGKSTEVLLKGAELSSDPILFSSLFWTFDKKMPYSYARG